jgi:hypothetical protein
VSIDTGDRDVRSLPLLDDAHVLPADVVEAFRRDGHALVRGLASAAEVQAYAGPICEAAMAMNTEDRELADRETYGKAFLQMSNVWVRDPRVQRFVMAPRFAGVAAALLGVPGVRLYHDQALFKEAGGGPTPFHQDHYYWPVEGSGAVTMWMPLRDIPTELGSLNFVSGSHRLGFLGEHEISDESEQVFSAMIAELGLPLASHGAMAAGDATFHNSWTLHGAPPNPTGHLRPVMTVIYVADDSRVVEPTSEPRRVDLERWLPGLVPGDLVASHLNPRLGPARSGSKG